MSLSRIARSRRPVVESLETRQLLSLTVDLRLPGGGKSATVTGTGQVINLEIWATVKGANASTSDEALQIAVGSLLSSNINGGAANGTLKAFNVSPFNSFGAQSGVQRDLDGDGDLDIGTNTSTDGSSFWAARAGGKVNGSAFKVGTATFTVTSLKSTTGQTNLAFRARTSGGTGGLWWEDGNQKQLGTGSYQAGSPVVLKRTGSTGGAKITGTVFSDNDKDGVLDSTDTRLSNRRIFIDANKDGKYNTGEKNVFSNSSGVYTFTNLAAGTYRVRRDMPIGYTNSVPSSGYYDVLVSGTVTVSNKHFGAIPITSTGTGKISGTLFSDTDKDGILDSGEARLSNRRMYIDANKDGKFNTGEKSVFSNSSGVYTFTGLSAGSYRIRRADLPTGYGYTVPSSGYYDIVLGSGASVTGKNFGFKTL